MASRGDIPNLNEPNFDHVEGQGERKELHDPQTVVSQRVEQDTGLPQKRKYVRKGQIIKVPVEGESNDKPIHSISSQISVQPNMVLHPQPLLDVYPQFQSQGTSQPQLQRNMLFYPSFYPQSHSTNPLLHHNQFNTHVPLQQPLHGNLQPLASIYHPCHSSNLMLDDNQLFNIRGPLLPLLHGGLQTRRKLSFMDNHEKN